WRGGWHGEGRQDRIRGWLPRSSVALTVPRPKCDRFLRNRPGPFRYAKLRTAILDMRRRLYNFRARSYTPRRIPMRITSLFSKKARVAVTAAVAAAMLLPATGMAQKKDTITWRVQSHWPASSSSYKDSLLTLKDKLAERTNGRLVLEPYEAGTLFSATDTFNAVRRGIIPMGTIAPGYIIDQVPLAGVASGLPFAFRKVEEAAYFHKELGFEQMMREATAKYGVYYSTDKVYPTEMVVRRPINSYADFTKLKIRSSGALQVFLTQAGATGTYVSGAELYTALSQGVIDGAHWGAVQGAYSLSLYEVAKYHVRPALNIAGTDVFIINQK